MMHTLDMPVKSIQISMDQDLLSELDAAPETLGRGRSAVIREAVRQYLDTRRRARIDAAYARAYGGKADEVLADFGPLMGAQTWPEP